MAYLKSPDSFEESEIETLMLLTFNMQIQLKKQLPPLITKMFLLPALRAESKISFTLLNFRNLAAKCSREFLGKSLKFSNGKNLFTDASLTCQVIAQKSGENSDDSLKNLQKYSNYYENKTEQCNFRYLLKNFSSFSRGRSSKEQKASLLWIFSIINSSILSSLQ